MSDIAYSCEYLTIQKTCLAASESPKAKATRDLKCRSEEKMGCCYLCSMRSGCSVRCRFLGEPQGSSVEEPIVEQAPDVNSQITDAVTEQNSQPVFCSDCSVEMTPKKAELTLTEDTDATVLPVLVYICPCCSRIELKAAS